MIENALKGSKRYWTWVFFLLAIIAIGVLFYLKQYHVGLGINRSVTRYHLGILYRPADFSGRCGRLRRDGGSAVLSAQLQSLWQDHHSG